MNAYERVMNTLQGKPVDRPPVLAILGFYGARLTGTSLKELYKDADLYVASQQAVIDTFGIDMVLAPFELSALAEAFRGEEAFFGNQAPNMNRPPAATVREALALPNPDPDTSARLPLILDATRKLAAIYKGTVPLFSTLPGPTSLPALIMGMEAWMETLLFDEPAAQHLLKQCGNFWVAWANAQFDAGADVLVVTEGMAAKTIATRELFEEKCLPHIRACFSEVQGPIIFHHTGGPINHMIDLVPGLPNVLGIAVSSQDDLYEAREKVGPGIPLFGNIDNLSFRSVTAEEIRSMATDCLKAGAEIGPVLLCNSGADLPIDTPPENIHALCDAARAFSPSNVEMSCEETLWVVCGVLQAEVEELRRRGRLQGEFCFLNSMLHMEPLRLEATLKGIHERKNQPVVFVYGDCCPAMLQLSSRPGAGRVGGINCCQLLLGRARYRELMHKEAFIMLPEWTKRWKEIIEQELGLGEAVARDLFQDNRGTVVYLDTGLVPIPEKELNACAEYIGLPIQMEQVGLEHLLEELNNAELVARKSLDKGGKR